MAVERPALHYLRTRRSSSASAKRPGAYRANARGWNTPVQCGSAPERRRRASAQRDPDPRYRQCLLPWGHRQFELSRKSPAPPTLAPSCSRRTVPFAACSRTAPKYYGDRLLDVSQQLRLLRGVPLHSRLWSRFAGCQRAAKPAREHCDPFRPPERAADGGGSLGPARHRRVRRRHPSMPA